MSTFHIDATQVWRVICKQCVEHAKFDNVDAAHAWMRDHECAGTR